MTAAGKAPTVLLLNPPARDIVFRDNYHSQVSKTGYVWHPNDLLVQSGFLAREFHVRLIDAVAERKGFAETMRSVVDMRPDHVFALVGSLTEDEDDAFLYRLKERLPSTSIVAAGDVLQFTEDDPFESHPFLDGVLTYMMAPTLADFFRDGKARHVWTRSSGRPPQPEGRSFSYPEPALDLFLDGRYRLQFSGGRPFHSITLTLGCPFACRFCIVPRFPRQIRDLDEAFDELNAVKKRGIRDLFVRDAMFGYRKDHAQKFCEGLIERGSPFRWHVFTRADYLEDDTIRMLVASGCHMVHIGVESWSDEVLGRERKRLTMDVLRDAFARCRTAGLGTSAHFVLGLDKGDSGREKELMRVVRLLNPDIASFNVFQGRPGLSRQDTARGAKASTDPELTRLQRKLTLNAHLRPGRALRILSNVRSIQAMKGLAGSVASLTGGRKPWRGVFREPTVSLVRCNDYQPDEVARALEAVLAPFGGARALGRPGQRLLIKPNLLRSAAPDRAVTTHPEVLLCCIRAARDAGMEPVVGDIPAIHEGSASGTAAATAGLLDVCRDEGVEWVSLAESGFSEVEVIDGTRVLIADIALEADAVLSLGKLKTHVLTGGTGTVKNMFGCVAPADRRRLHRTLNVRRFSRVVAAIYGLLPIRFTILDGVIGMEGAGPGQGRPRRLGLLMGGPDGVAVDRVGASVSGMDKRRQPVLLEASGMGHGINDMDGILVIGEDPARVRVQFRLPPPVPDLVNALFTQLHFNTFSIHPFIDADLCEKCGECVDACPTGSIDLDDVPSINLETCVSCFCCHEVCPNGAISEKYGSMGRLWQRLRRAGFDKDDG
ncbi:MAG: DUF362 domain-containing protein [Deltaproteobacteria bacterium]|nr:DUF362 domain-containing protein [Deltaproteobacteria bacterium]